MIKRLTELYYVIIVLVFIVGIWSYIIITEYFLNSCQDKYGFSYNNARKKMQIPVIPKFWHIKKHEKDFILWGGSDFIIGHQRKSIAFLGCDISGELDLYKLPLQNGKGRWIEIEYNYGPKLTKDSLKYTYQIDHHAEEISKKVTDSIFNAEKMEKDY